MFYELIRLCKREVECNSQTYRALGPCQPPMQINHTANVSQPDVRAIKFVLRMEALQCTEGLVYIVNVKPNAVVFDEEDFFASVLSATNLDFGMGTRIAAC